MHEFVSGNRKTTVKPIRDKGRERDDFLSKVKWKEWQTFGDRHVSCLISLFDFSRNT